jgi:type IV secretory pathway VirB2 component (pilin)
VTGGVGFSLVVVRVVVVLVTVVFGTVDFLVVVDAKKLDLKFF